MKLAANSCDWAVSAIDRFAKNYAIKQLNESSITTRKAQQSFSSSSPLFVESTNLKTSSSKLYDTRINNHAQKNIKPNLLLQCNSSNTIVRRVLMLSEDTNTNVITGVCIINSLTHNGGNLVRPKITDHNKNVFPLPSQLESCDMKKISNVLTCKRQEHNFSFSLPQEYLLHNNHLIGWDVDKVAKLFYVHTLDELSRVNITHLNTLQPENCILCSNGCLWESWRELLTEPSCQLCVADELVIDRILSKTVSINELTQYF